MNVHLHLAYLVSALLPCVELLPCGKFVLVTRGDISTTIRSNNAYACTQGGAVAVDDIVVRASLQLYCGFHPMQTGSLLSVQLPPAPRQAIRCLFLLSHSPCLPHIRCFLLTCTRSCFVYAFFFSRPFTLVPFVRPGHFPRSASFAVRWLVFVERFGCLVTHRLKTL